MFLLMFAEFLALVQVLIYGGAVVIVVLFSLMLTRIQDFENLTDHRQWPLAALFAIGVFVLAGCGCPHDKCTRGRARERRISRTG